MTEQQEYCGDCDGTGWVEGGKTLQTICRRCGGSGWEPRKKEVRDYCPKRTLAERVATLESVLIDLFRENAHILVGGVAFAENSINQLRGAADRLAEEEAVLTRTLDLAIEAADALATRLEAEAADRLAEEEVRDG